MTEVNKIDVSKMTTEELMQKANELKALQAMMKEARKLGIAPKAAPKAGKEKEYSAEVIGLIAELKVVLDSHKATIDKLFEDTKDAEKPHGNIGVNLRIDDFPYDFQLLSDAARKAQQDAAKAKKEAEKAAKKEPEKVDEPEVKGEEPTE